MNLEGLPDGWRRDLLGKRTSLKSLVSSILTPSAMNEIIKRAFEFYEANPKYEEPPKFIVRGQPTAKYEEYIQRGLTRMAEEEINLEIQFTGEKEVKVTKGFVGCLSYPFTYENGNWILSAVNRRTGQRNHWLETQEEKEVTKKIVKILTSLITEKHFKEANRVMTANGVRHYVEQRKQLLEELIPKTDTCIVEMMMEYESLK